MADISPRALAGLAFWARNMVFYRRRGTVWPFFNYTDAEWARMDVLAQAAQRQFQAFLAVNTVLFLALAALGMAVIFMPLATWLFPVPDKTPALGFALLLAACTLFIVGGGLPITMNLAGRLVADAAMQAKLSPQAGDAALAAKARWQIWRIMLVGCAVLVIGVLFTSGK